MAPQNVLHHACFEELIGVLIDDDEPLSFPCGPAAFFA
jgi:hypothetical protein